MRQLLVSACLMAAFTLNAQTDASPLGVWAWTFNSPEGVTMNGTFELAKTGEEYTGSISSAEGTIELQEVKVEGSVLKQAKFDYDGYPINIKGTFADETFKGFLVVDYNEMPFNAMRQEAAQKLKKEKE